MSRALKIRSFTNILIRKCTSTDEFMYVEKLLTSNCSISLLVYIRLHIIPNIFLKYMLWCNYYNYDKWHHFALENVNTVPHKMLQFSGSTILNCRFNKVVKDANGRWLLKTNAVQWSRRRYFVKLWNDAKKTNNLSDLLQPMNDYIEKCQKTIRIMQHDNNFKKIIDTLSRLKDKFACEYQIHMDIPMYIVPLPPVDLDEKDRINYIDDRYVLVKLVVNDDIRLSKIKNLFK